LWKLREGGSEWVYYIALANRFTYAVELIRFALYGEALVLRLISSRMLAS